MIVATDAHDACFICTNECGHSINQDGSILSESPKGLQGFSIEVNETKIDDNSSKAKVQVG